MDGESSAHGGVHSALAETYPRPQAWHYNLCVSLGVRCITF